MTSGPINEIIHRTILATAEVPDEATEEIGNVFADTSLTLVDAGRAAAIVVAAFVVARLVRFILKRGASRGGADTFLADLSARIAGYVIVAFGVLYGLETLGVAIGPLLGALGIFGIAIAFALQDILENFVAGLMLQLRRPFGPSDEISSGDHEGTVVSVDARTVVVRTPDGETVRIPSAQVIKAPIVNHTQNGRRRTSIEVGVAYGTDLPHALEVALDAVGSVDETHNTPPPEAYVTRFGESSIDLTVRFWHEPSIAGRWRVRNAAALAIDAAFAEHAIDIPFPQRTVHLPQPQPDRS